jgi:hypothetical protein
VARKDLERVTRDEVGVGAVVGLDVQRAGDQVAEVVYLAAGGSGDRPDVVRPAPARTELGPPDRATADGHQGVGSFGELADLVGPVEALHLWSGHDCSFSVPGGYQGRYEAGDDVT